MTDVAHILGEFIAAWNAGRRPRLADYLERAAPEHRDELADQIETFLMLAPEPDFDENTWQEMTSSPTVRSVAEAAFAEPEPWPTLLPRLRERAGLSWADVAERLGFRDRTKAVSRFEEMESGRLDPTRPTRTLLERLASVFGVTAETLDWRGGGGFASPRAAGALRASEPDVAARRQMDVIADMLLTDDQEPDEVDELFLGGRE